MEKFARVNSATGKGMNQGYIFNDGDYYCETEAEAKIHVESLGLNFEEELKTIDTEEEWFFWTDWSETLDEEETWYDAEGQEYKTCYNCHEETAVNEEFYFCTHCLTHL